MALDREHSRKARFVKDWARATAGNRQQAARFATFTPEGIGMRRNSYDGRLQPEHRLLGPTPTDNALVKSFNGRLRQERLNEHWFLSLEDPRSKIAAWRRFYNEERPHSSLA